MANNEEEQNQNNSMFTSNQAGKVLEKPFDSLSKTAKNYLYEDKDTDESGNKRGSKNIVEYYRNETRISHVDSEYKKEYREEKRLATNTAEIAREKKEMSPEAIHERQDYLSHAESSSVSGPSTSAATGIDSVSSDLNRGNENSLSTGNNSQKSRSSDTTEIAREKKEMSPEAIHERQDYLSHAESSLDSGPSMSAATGIGPVSSGSYREHENSPSTGSNSQKSRSADTTEKAMSSGSMGSGLQSSPESDRESSETAKSRIQTSVSSSTQSATISGKGNDALATTPIRTDVHKDSGTVSAETGNASVSKWSKTTAIRTAQNVPSLTSNSSGEEYSASGKLGTLINQNAYPSVAITDEAGNSALLNIGEGIMLSNGAVIGYDLDGEGTPMVFTNVFNNSNVAGRTNNLSGNRSDGYVADGMTAKTLVSQGKTEFTVSEVTQINNITTVTIDFNQKGANKTATGVKSKDLTSDKKLGLSQSAAKKLKTEAAKDIACTVIVRGASVAGSKVIGGIAMLLDGMDNSKAGARLAADKIANYAVKTTGKVAQKGAKAGAKKVYNSKPATYIKGKTTNVVAKVAQKASTVVASTIGSTAIGRAFSAASKPVKAIANRISSLFSSIADAFGNLRRRMRQLVIGIGVVALAICSFAGAVGATASAIASVFGFFFESDEDIWSDYEDYINDVENEVRSTNNAWTTAGSNGEHRIPDTNESIKEGLSSYSNVLKKDYVSCSDDFEDIDYGDKTVLLDSSWYSSLESYSIYKNCHTSEKYTYSSLSSSKKKEIKSDLLSYVSRICSLGDEYSASNGSDSLTSTDRNIYIMSPVNYTFTGGINGANWRAFFACTQIYSMYVPGNLASAAMSYSGLPSSKVYQSQNNIVRAAYADDKVAGPYGCLDPKTTNPFVSYKKMFNGQNSGNENPFIDVSITLDGDVSYYKYGSNNRSSSQDLSLWQDEIQKCIQYKYYVLIYDAICEEFYEDKISYSAFTDWKKEYVDKVESGLIDNEDVLYHFDGYFTDKDEYPNARSLSWETWKEYKTDCNTTHKEISHVCPDVKNWNTSFTGVSSRAKAISQCQTITDDAVYIKKDFYAYMNDVADGSLDGYIGWFDNLSYYSNLDGNEEWATVTLNDDDMGMLESLYESDDLFMSFPDSIRSTLENSSYGNVYSFLGASGWEIMAFFVTYESGSAGARSVGGDGGRAYGIFQFDYEYSLVPFLKYCYEYDSSKYSMFKYYISCGKGSSELKSQGMKNAWLQACDQDEAEFTNLQYQYSYDNYYVPAAQKIIGLGFDVNSLCDSAKGAIWSASIQHGTGGASEVAKKAGLSNSMDDKEFIESYYDARISLHPKFTSRFTSEKAVCISLIGTESSSTGARIISYAQTLLGLPYKYGATGPDSYDCSGFTQACYASVGISIPRSSALQYARALKRVPVSQARVGDILWKSGHVALYAGNNQTIEAPRTGDVISYKNVGSRFTYCLRFY